jgi:hypothetical protein
MGAGKIRDALPPLLEAVKDSGATPLWVTDPMHGNGITTPTGYKTRRFDDVVEEVRGFFEAHRVVGTFPGGIHVELTGEPAPEPHAEPGARLPRGRGAREALTLLPARGRNRRDRAETPRFRAVRAVSPSE